MTRCVSLSNMDHSDMCDGCRAVYDATYVKPSKAYTDHFHLTVAEIYRRYRCTRKESE